MISEQRLVDSAMMRAGITERVYRITLPVLLREHMSTFNNIGRLSLIVVASVPVYSGMSRTERLANRPEVELNLSLYLFRFPALGYVCFHNHSFAELISRS